MTCVFCKRGDLSSTIVGDTYTKAGVTVHEYCLYFSSGLVQSGSIKQDGICGFMISDIMAEVQRGSSRKMLCGECRKPGKFVGCAVSNCRSGGHYPCLYKKGYLFQYHGSFLAFCPRHSPQQPPVRRPSSNCCICLSALSESAVYCPSCRTHLHRSCVQKQAWMAGRYFFRCPTCNNEQEFRDEMLRMGIAIPERDAVWETDNYFGAEFEDVKVCQVANCLCPLGREHVSRKYRMIKCQTCGQWMGHILCLQGRPKECSVCAKVAKGLSLDKTTCTIQQASLPDVNIITLTGVTSGSQSHTPTSTTDLNLPKMPLSNMKIKLLTPKIVLHKLTQEDIKGTLGGTAGLEPNLIERETVDSQLLTSLNDITNPNHALEQSTVNNGAEESIVNNGAKESAVNNGAEENIVNNGAEESAVNNGTEENTVNNGAEESAVNNGTEENTVNNGAEENFVNNGAEENFVNNGTEEYIVKIGAEEYTVNIGAEEYIVNNGAEEYIVNNGAEEYIVNNGAEENIVNNGAEENIVNNGAEENIVNNGTEEYIMNNVMERSTVNKTIQQQTSNTQAPVTRPQRVHCESSCPIESSTVASWSGIQETNTHWVIRQDVENEFRFWFSRLNS